MSCLAGRVLLCVMCGNVKILSKKKCRSDGTVEPLSRLLVVPTFRLQGKSMPAQVASVQAGGWFWANHRKA